MLHFYLRCIFYSALMVIPIPPAWELAKQCLLSVSQDEFKRIVCDLDLKTDFFQKYKKKCNRSYRRIKFLRLELWSGLQSMTSNCHTPQLSHFLPFWFIIVQNSIFCSCFSKKVWQFEVMDCTKNCNFSKLYKDTDLTTHTQIWRFLTKIRVERFPWQKRIIVNFVFTFLRAIEW